MIDLNTAGEQREGSGGAINPGSMVLVQLTVRQPAQNKSGSMPGLTVAKSGLEYLDCELEVIAGSHKGKKFWHNMNVAGGDGGTKHMKAIEISMRTVRAILEAYRNIQPKEASPEAAVARRMNAWTDLNGLWFPVKVGCELSQCKRFVNNTVDMVITPDREEYAYLMQGGEILTTNPLPQAQADAAQPATTYGAPPVAGRAGAPAAAPQYAPPAQAAQTPPPSVPQAGPVPAWGQRPPAATPPNSAVPPQTAPY